LPQRASVRASASPPAPDFGPDLLAQKPNRETVPSSRSDRWWCDATLGVSTIRTMPCAIGAPMPYSRESNSSCRACPTLSRRAAR
jgi:hypothetical protein